MFKCYAGLAQFFDVSVESFVSFLTSWCLGFQHAYFSFVMSNFLLCWCPLANKPSAHAELGCPLSEIFVQESHLVYLILVQSLGLSVYSRNLLSFLAVVVRFRESIRYFVSKVFIKLAKFFIVLNEGRNWSVELADLLLQVVVEFLRFGEVFLCDWRFEISAVRVRSNVGLTSTFRLWASSCGTLNWLGLGCYVGWGCIFFIEWIICWNLRS